MYIEIKRSSAWRRQLVVPDILKPPQPPVPDFKNIVDDNKNVGSTMSGVLDDQINKIKSAMEEVFSKEVDKIGDKFKDVKEVIMEPVQALKEKIATAQALLAFIFIIILLLVVLFCAINVTSIITQFASMVKAFKKLLRCFKRCIRSRGKAKNYVREEPMGGSNEYVSFNAGTGRDLNRTEEHIESREKPV
ncbi:hypothetical protein B0J11DRAFT_501800 [Dendryphion nanum]|uniref:Uncharacterized protein n=1 Tax=Dendryphion nanum TaxID=256645 RepID=A0A9P9IWL5_9PLEO|nr:hypothetical protein B0J11DRAFT_501800 [Dendryphion nanum]